MAVEIQRWSDTRPPDMKALKRKLESEGYSVSEWTDAAGTVYDSHSHESDQAHWVVSGEVEFVVNGETYQLRPGDRDFLPANTEHTAVVLGNEPLHYLIGVKLR